MNVAAERLKSFVERIERLEEDGRELGRDKAEVYAEAKGEGFDTKVMRAIIAQRRQDHAQRQEFESILELYKSALGMA